LGSRGKRGGQGNIERETPLLREKKKREVGGIIRVTGRIAGGGGGTSRKTRQVINPRPTPRTKIKGFTPARKGRGAPRGQNIQMPDPLYLNEGGEDDWTRKRD